MSLSPALSITGGRLLRSDPIAPKRPWATLTPTRETGSKEFGLLRTVNADLETSVRGDLLVMHQPKPSQRKIIQRIVLSHVIFDADLAHLLY
jgi:hypothetical protein